MNASGNGRLVGRTAIVTGAAHGERASLGVAFAKALAREGAKVVVADIKDTSDVAREIEADGGHAWSFRVDVTQEAQINEMVARTIERFGTLEILVNNAALGSNIPAVAVTELTVEEWDKLMAVNVRGPFLCVKASVHQMRKQGYGKIINIASTTMMTGRANPRTNTSAKGAILGMTRSLAGELGKDGIRVNAVAFGLVNSALTEESFRKNPEREAQMLGKRALPIHYRAEDLGATIVYLASADSDHMTGQCLVVDAGEHYY